MIVMTKQSKNTIVDTDAGSAKNIGNCFIFNKQASYLERNMIQALSPETIAIVKSTSPALQAHGVAISTRMYERLFVDPQIKALFDEAAHTSGTQPKRLAAAIVAYAKNIDNLDVLSGALEKISERHVQTRIKAEHYPAVADALLPAIKDVLGEAVDEKVLDAWGQAYWYLANILIDREKKLYKSDPQSKEHHLPS